MSYTKPKNKTEELYHENKNGGIKRDGKDYSYDACYRILLNETPLIGDLIMLVIDYDNEPKIVGNFEKTICKCGSGSDNFLCPRGIVTDNEYIYVSDEHNHRIKIIDTNGALIRSFGKIGIGDEMLLFPRSVSIYKSQLYIVDSGNFAIKIISVPDCKFIKKIKYQECRVTEIYVYKSWI